MLHIESLFLFIDNSSFSYLTRDLHIEGPATQLISVKGEVKGHHYAVIDYFLVMNIYDVTTNAQYREIVNMCFKMKGSLFFILFIHLRLYTYGVRIFS